MDKLIITYCISDPLLTAREMADAARAARDAGAAVAHVHKPFAGQDKLRSPYPLEAWQEVGKLIAQETDIIFQHGMGGRPYMFFEHRVPIEERPKTFDFRAEKAEMISFHLGAIDHAYAPARPDTYVMPTREEIAKCAQVCRDNKVKPEYEVWHVGVYWNLNWLIEQKLVDPPHWLTLFFGGNSGVTSPPTVEELHNRVRNVPQPSLWEVSVQRRHGIATAEQQRAIFVEAILMGGHIRVGAEDSLSLWDDVPAKTPAELVEGVARVTRDLGREIATPDEARRMMGLAPRSKNKS